MENKIDKFERLAEKRINEALKKIRLIGNLANKRNYNYTNDHVTQIFDAIDAEVKNLKIRFKEESNSKDELFHFKRIK